MKTNKSPILPLVPSPDDKAGMSRYMQSVNQFLQDLSLNARADLDTVDGSATSLDARVTALESVDGGYVGVRNTTLAGSVSATGYANFLSKDGANDNVKLSATTTPVIIAISDGFDSSGVKEHIVSISSDVVPAAWSGLTTDGTYYLYADYDPGSSVVTYGKTATLVVPQDVYFLGAAGTATLHNFVIPEMKMYVDSGAAWSQVRRRFVGEVVVSGSHVTSVITYALMGQYIGALQTVPNIGSFAGAGKSAAHNIGTQELTVQAFFQCIDADDGYAAGDRILVTSFVSTNTAGTLLSQPNIYSDRLSVGLRWRSDAYRLASTNKTSGAFSATENGKWAVLFKVNRSY